MADFIGEASGPVGAPRADENQNRNQSASGGRKALLGKQGPLVPLLLGVIVLLFVVLVGMVWFGGASEKSFTAKGMIRDSTGYMYDPSDATYESIFAGTEIEELLRLDEQEPSCTGGDLDETSILTIADAAGKVLATTPLTFRPELSMGRDLENWLDRGWCGFTFEVPDIKSDSEFFQLTVSNTVDGIPPVERQQLIDGAEIQLSGGFR